MIVFPNEKLLQRWDLETLRRDGPSRASPIDGHVHFLGMCCDSNGPALAWWSDEGASGSQSEYQFSFIDPDSLTVSPVGLIASGAISSDLSTSGGSFRFHIGAYGPLYIRASAGGGLFECGVRARSLHGRVLVGHRELYGNHDDHPMVPGPDGRSVFTRWSGRCDPDGNAIGPDLQGRFPAVEFLVRSYDPAYYLSVVGLNVPGDSSAPLACEIHAADGSHLLTVHGLDEMAARITPEEFRAWNANDFTTDKRFHFVPAAHLLITIPAEHDRLVLRRLDLEDSMGRAGGDYLFVVSAPLLGATAGKPLEHTIEARSKVGGVVCALESGPDGLTVSADGKLTWRVPIDQKGEDVTLVVRVQDASGQKRIHNLMIRVR